MNLISTDEAAARLGVSGRRVRQLIDEGKLPAQVIGGTFVINESDLDAVTVYGKPGRPPGKKPEASPVSKKAKRAKKGAE